MKNLGEKISEHKMILITAVLFDFLAILPFVSVIFNFLFGLILYLYFSVRKEQKNFLGMAAFMVFGSLIDLIISILPVNTAAVLVRILKKK